MKPLDIFPLPAFEDNYIWCLRRDRALAVVDPGDAAPVLRHLADSGARLAAILITHHHRDHTGGIAELIARHPVPVFAPAAETVAGTTHPLQGGDRIELPGVGIDFEVLDFAGHTRGHLGYYRPGTLFCGDTLFGCGCGRLFEGTAAQMHASLQRLADRPASTRVCCAHEYTESNLRFAHLVEPDNEDIALHATRCRALRAAGKPTLPSTLDIERRINPFLRTAVPAVQAAARHHGAKGNDEVAVFAALREWKNKC